MALTSITVEIEEDTLARFDAIAQDRGISRSELMQQACQSLIRHIQMVNPGHQPDAPVGQHAVHTNEGAAALWAAAWLEEVIDPEDLM